MTVSELMSPKRKSTEAPQAASKKPAPMAAASNAIHGRNALIEYIQNPTKFSPSRVISHDDNFVAIHDLYPKSSVHFLLLPRDSSKYLLHPFDAFEDTVFLSRIQFEIAKLKALAASELRRKYARFSASESARNAAFDAEPPPTVLPQGRDWSKEIVAGVHAHPSMNHLHIHVLSVDRVSECMRHRKHYNSFVTPFLVPTDDFPLAKGDVRRHPGKERYLERDLKCWRCGKNFGNQFKQLKVHLDEELEEWKKV